MWHAIPRLSLGALALFTVTAVADPRYQEAQVIDVEPIIETVESVEPGRRCWFERPGVGELAPSASAPLLGALIGGAIGNAVGHNKRNKQVGAIVGAVLGGSIGHDIARQEASRSAAAPRVRRQVCGVVEVTRHRDRVAGYLVTYRYAGETYRARMDQRPGERIRVRVRVTPA